MLSVVIPVYNERETLFELLRRVLGAPVEIAREIILVDDASKDGTQELYPLLDTQFPNANIRLFKQPVNQGKGAAIRRGFTEARGDIIVVQDADLEYDPKDYPKLLRPILDGRADVVYGSRFIGAMNTGCSISGTTSATSS
jgi:glycosyltransferase involved in cell wall biosynthesis